MTVKYMHTPSQFNEANKTVVDFFVFVYLNNASFAKTKLMDWITKINQTYCHYC